MFWTQVQEWKSFTKTILFRADFLNHFQNYNWKLAYTDMSVDIQKIADQQEEKKQIEETEEESCNLLAGFNDDSGRTVYWPRCSLTGGFWN